MARLLYGQVNFSRLLPMKTCHDIRSWRACSYCGSLGDKSAMMVTGKDNLWHGRCFAKKFGMERMLEMPRAELVKLSLGDLGVDLMKTMVSELGRKKGR